MFYTAYVISILHCIITGVLASNTEDRIIGCNATVTDLNNKIVKVSTYCADKPCLPKCCGDNEILYKNATTKIIQCTKVKELSFIDFEKYNITLNYTNLNIYNSNFDKDDVKLSKVKHPKDFKFVQNKVPLNETCGQMWVRTFPAYILENGNFVGDMKNYKEERWFIKEPDSYCMELVVAADKDGHYRSIYKYHVLKPQQKIVVDIASQLNFTGVGMLISSFFFVLVLVVYCLLPQLQNLSGMLLMVYVATMFLSFLMKGILIFNPNVHFKTCKIVSPIMYFSFLSSFLWLNVMSFDIWWTFRGMRFKRAIHRHGEIVKFLWYGLFAWGVAAAMTLSAVLVDNADLSDWPNIVVPAFATCFHESRSNLRYLYAPIGIITLINFVLFLMTIYNIWQISQKLNDTKNSNISNKNNNRFRLFIKMSLLMGISWVLEVVQSFYDDFDTWLYILINLYNTFMGVAIFVLFICNKATFLMLCKRLNIKWKFTNELALNSSTRTIESRPSRNNDSYCKTKTTEDCEIEMYETSIN